MEPRLHFKVILMTVLVNNLFSDSKGFFVHPWIVNIYKPQGNDDSKFCLPPGTNDTGKHLSPIDIQIGKVEKLSVPPLSFSNSHWESKNYFILNNTGHLADFTQCPPRRSMTLSGGPLPSIFKFDSIHSHWHPFSDFYGSEHSIDQQRYAMEFHAIYFNKNYRNIEIARGKPDGLAVCSFIVESIPGGHYNPAFEYLSAAANKVTDAYALTLVQYNVFLPFRRLAKSEKYFHYSGTVTGDTTEPVKWIIFKDTIHVHPSQIEPFRRLLTSRGEFIHNIREVQPKHDRIVYSIDNSKPNLSKKFWKFLGLG